MKYYYPYISDKPEKKYFIITRDNKKVYFGQASASDFTIHKDEERKQRYILRHQKRELQYWNNPNYASYWSLNLLWNKKSIKESYEDIKKDLKRKGYI